MTGNLARKVDEVQVSDEQLAEVLRLVEQEPNIGHALALRRAGVPGTKGQLGAYVDAHPELVDDVNAARGKRIRTEILRRAIDGVEEPVYTPSGRLAGSRVVYSDRLLEFAARLYLEEAKQLRTGRVEVTGADGGPMEVQTDVADAIDRLNALVAAAAVRQAAGDRPADISGLAVGDGEGRAGLPVARLDRETEPGAAAG